jgi:hypothetical protein
MDIQIKKILSSVAVETARKIHRITKHAIFQVDWLHSPNFGFW